MFSLLWLLVQSYNYSFFFKKTLILAFVVNVSGSNQYFSPELQYFSSGTPMPMLSSINVTCRCKIAIRGIIEVIFLGRGTESTVTMWVMALDSNKITSVAASRLPKKRPRSIGKGKIINVSGIECIRWVFLLRHISLNC